MRILGKTRGDDESDAEHPGSIQVREPLAFVLVRTLLSSYVNDGLWGPSRRPSALLTLLASISSSGL
jgi:hypothetical protein